MAELSAAVSRFSCQLTLPSQWLEPTWLHHVSSHHEGRTWNSEIPCVNLTRPQHPDPTGEGTRGPHTRRGRRGRRRGRGAEGAEGRSKYPLGWSSWWSVTRIPPWIVLALALSTRGSRPFLYNPKTGEPGGLRALAKSAQAQAWKISSGRDDDSFGNCQ